MSFRVRSEGGAQKPTPCRELGQCWRRLRRLVPRTQSRVSLVYLRNKGETKVKEDERATERRFIQS